MTDRPILFSAPMVRALLDGRKTQTRRVAKLYPSIDGKRFAVFPPEEIIELDGGEFRSGVCHYASTGALSGPYRLPTAVGDRLYVREAWRTIINFDAHSPKRVEALCLDAGYRKPWAPLQFEADSLRVNWEMDVPGKFRQGMHMPRWASRLTLIVTDVRVQRLQEISEKDAKAEGIVQCGRFYGVAEAEWDEASTVSRADAFANLWDSLNASRGYGWDGNPWVVALSFTIHHQNIDAIGASA